MCRIPIRLLTPVAAVLLVAGDHEADLGGLGLLEVRLLLLPPFQHHLILHETTQLLCSYAASNYVLLSLCLFLSTEALYSKPHINPLHTQHIMSFVPKPKVLFILSSHSKFGDTGNPTGWYLPEFAHPYAVLAPHAEISVASPAGGEAPLDPGSVELFKEDPVCMTFYKQQSHLWKNTDKLENYIGKAADFDLIFVAGGHGPLWDLTDNASLQKLLAEFYDSGKVVAAVCHGTCALLNVKLTNGELIIKDQPVTGFSNDEEKQIGLDEAVPFSLQTELIKNGGKYEKASAPWGAHISVGRNGRMITGQNPASAAGIAELFLKSYNSGRK